MIKDLLIHSTWYGFALLDTGNVECLGHTMQQPDVVATCNGLYNVESLFMQDHKYKNVVMASYGEFEQSTTVYDPEGRHIKHRHTPSGADTRLASKGQCEGCQVHGVPVSEHVLIPDAYYAAQYLLTLEGSLYQRNGKGGQVQFNPDIRVKHIYNLCGHPLALTMEGYLIAFPKSKTFVYSMQTDYTSHDLFPDYLLHKGT